MLGIYQNLLNNVTFGIVNSLFMLNLVINYAKYLSIFQLDHTLLLKKAHFQHENKRISLELTQKTFPNISETYSQIFTNSKIKW